MFLGKAGTHEKGAAGQLFIFGEAMLTLVAVLGAAFLDAMCQRLAIGVVVMLDFGEIICASAS